MTAKSCKINRTEENMRSTLTGSETDIRKEQNQQNKKACSLDGSKEIYLIFSLNCAKLLKQVGFLEGGNKAFLQAGCLGSRLSLRLVRRACCKTHHEAR